MSTALLASDAITICEGFGSVEVTHVSGAWRGLFDAVDRQVEEELQGSPGSLTRKTRYYTLTCASARLQDADGKRVVLDEQTLTIDGSDYRVRDARWKVDGAITDLLVVK